MEGIAYEIEISGLKGGHSGAEIHKERGNSNCLFGRLLWNLTERLGIGIQALEGGLADNAIPRETRAVLVATPEDSAAFTEICDATAAGIGEELATRDPEFRISVTEKKKGSFLCVKGQDARRAAGFLNALPNGVQAMSPDMPGLVETSLNLGMLRLTEEGLCAGFSVRSSVESAKHALIARLSSVTALAGGSQNVTGDYPGWKYRINSPLRDKMTALYEDIYIRGNRRYWLELDQRMREFTERSGLPYLRNDDSMKRAFSDPPAVVNYFFHEEIIPSARKAHDAEASIKVEK